MAAHLPRFLVLKRRYEIDESSPFVKFAREYGPTFISVLRGCVLAGPMVMMGLGRGMAYAGRGMSYVGRGKVHVARGATYVGRGVSQLGGGMAYAGRGMGRVGRRRISFGRQFRKPVLFFQWGRMPHEWELAFVTRMNSIEAQGVPILEVLKSDLPLVIGDAPTTVLLRSVGTKARHQPKRFVNEVRDMFGSSGKKVIMGLNDVFDPERYLEAHRAPEEPLQSVIDAIQQADEAREASSLPPVEEQELPTGN